MPVRDEHPVLCVAARLCHIMLLPNANLLGYSCEKLNKWWRRRVTSAELQEWLQRERPQLVGSGHAATEGVVKDLVVKADCCHHPANTTEPLMCKDVKGFEKYSSSQYLLCKLTIFALLDRGQRAKYICVRENWDSGTEAGRSRTQPPTPCPLRPS